MSKEFRGPFWVGAILAVLSVAVYAWERRTGGPFEMFPLLYHGGLMLLGLGLMAPRLFPATLETIRAVFGRAQPPDGAP